MNLKTKKCSKCKKLKLFENFYYSNNKISSYCKSCTIKYQCNWAKDNRVKYNKKAKLKNIKLRKEVFLIYGNKCECCREENYEFLSVEHIWKRKSKKYKQFSINHSHLLYRYLKKKKKRLKGYSLLCMNCNWSKGKYGYCPHG